MNSTIYSQIKIKIMEITKIEISFTKNLGNYESLKVGAEFTPDKNLTDEQNAVACDQQIRAMADAIVADRIRPIIREQPQPAQPQLRPQPTRFTIDPKPNNVLTKSNPRFEKVCKALAEHRADFGDVKKVFSVIDEDVIEYFKENHLI